MDSQLEKIDTCDKFLGWIDRIGFGPHFFVGADYGMLQSVWPLNSFDDSTIPDGSTCTTREFFSGTPNEHNFFVMREYGRLLKGEYRVPLFFGRLKRTMYDKGAGHISKYWWHAVHVSVNDSTRVAFTPNAEYGKRDRQVVMNMGRYLKKFYSEYLNDDEIRDLANIGKDQKILWAHTADEIRHIYEYGPQSCMKGERAPEMYAYKYPEAEGGDYEFGLSYLMNKSGENIVARALVSLRHKVYPRFYGDEGPVLDSLLKDAGFTKVESMGDYPTRILHEEHDEDSRAIVMPYLDGDDKRVYGILKDSAGVEYWQWGGNTPDGTTDERYADSSNGMVYANGVDPDDDDDDDNYHYCGCCDSRTHDDDLRYSEHHNMDICTSCADESYVYAYYGAHGNTTLVHTDSVILNNSNDEYFLDTVRNLKYHNIVQVEDGDYYDRSDTVKLLDGRRIHQDDPDNFDLVVAGENDEEVWCDRSEIDEDWVGQKTGWGFIWHHPQFAYTLANPRSILDWLAEGEVEAVRNFVEDDDKVEEWLDQVTEPAAPAPQVQFTEMA